MAKRPAVFKPTLYKPESFNNYPGTTFRCFTQGDTLPFEFKLSRKDGDDFDITGWQVKVAFSKELDDASGLLVTIPLTDVANKTFQGEVTSDQTKTLTPGVSYAIAKFIKPTGEEHIIDMCILEVYQNLNFTLV